MNIMKTILLMIVGTYVFISLLLFFFQRKLMYFPTPKVSIENEKEISFEVNGVKLYGWIVNEGNEKALIYYGGNAESIEGNISFFKTILPQYSVYLVNYRGYGKSEGKPYEKGLYLDAEAIYEKVAKKHKSISIMGRSLGSGVATYIASKKNIHRLVLVAPYDSVQNVAKSIYKFFPIELLLKDKFDSAKRVADIKAKTLILYGSDDEIIRPIHTKNLSSYFKDGSLQVVKIDKAQHNNIAIFEKYTQTIKNFLE